MTVKIFRVSLAVIILLSFSDVFSQDYAETALLFSRTRPGGSARIQALGGSQIALGGDYSSAGSNPAGLGMFNKSEFTFSTALTANTTSAFFKPSPNFDGVNAEDDRTVFNIPGISLVWHMPKENGKFLGGSLAISLSRTNDFNRATFYKGNNDQNSIIDYFIEQANGATTAQFGEDSYNFNSPVGLAYYNYLIGARSILSPPGPNDQYFTDAGWPEQGQQEEILVKGATNQWSFSYGGNVDDKFFFGGGLGISSLRYKSQKILTEYYSYPDTITVESMQLNENLDIRGTGVNVTLGAMVRPVDFVQIGVSYTTPTFYNLSETYEASMDTHWNNYDYFGDGDKILNDESASTDIITSDYNLRIPSKFSTGITFLSKYGFLTGEIELTNPGNAKYSSDTPGISYSDNNEDIRAINKSTMNYRMGAEFRYDIYRVRAGFGIQSNSYRKEFDADNQITTISGGAGIRLKTFYIDFALVSNSSGKYYYQPYTFSDGSGPMVDLKSRIITGMITAGFTF
jgi:hypothetical protein